MITPNDANRSPFRAVRMSAGLLAGLVAATVLLGSAAGPAEARQEIIRPHVQPRVEAPRMLHRPRANHLGAKAVLAAVRMQSAHNLARRAKDGAGSGKDDLESLETRERDLEARLEAIRERFLESEDGEDARRRIDDEADKREENRRALEEEKIRRDQEALENCCGYGERIEIVDWYQLERERIDETYDDAVEDIVEDELRETDPEAYLDYQKTKAVLDATRGEIEQAEAEPGGAVQP